MRNRVALKSATREAHDRAEATWTREDRFKSRDLYLSWLRAMLRTHLDFGLPAARHLNDDDLITHELARLDALGQDLLISNQDKVPSHPQSISWAWGVQYVVNGSALGASILLKTGSIAPTWPKAYLKEMQSFASGGSLNTFFRELDAVNLDLTEATRGAKDAFSKLIGATG